MICEATIERLTLSKTDIMEYFSRILILALSLTLFQSVGYSQDNKEVMKPIELLLEGIGKSDTSLIKQAFAKNVILKVISEEGSKAYDLDFLLERIMEQKNSGTVAKEEIYNTEIRVDGNLAHVWTDYSFYVGDKLSHCGIDSIALIKLEGVWKIVYIMDTRRKDGCEEEGE